jgi:sugar phosphate isomerase/epimerase
MNRRQSLRAIAAGVVAPQLRAFAPARGRFRPAICAYSFRDQLKGGSFTYADLIRMAADLGADGIDLTTYWLPDTTDETLFALKKLAYRSGVSIYTIGVRARMAQPTPELQSAEVELVRKWLDVAQRLGASHMRIFGGAIPKGATEEQTVAMAVDTLKRCAVDAAARGITLGVEDDGGITTNAGPTVEIVKRAASPWVGINLDTGNFPDRPYEQIEQCAPYATNVHFKSEVRTASGNQPADWPRILSILDKAGYHGYLALEYEATVDPMTTVPKLIAKMKEVIRAAGTHE